MILRSLTADQIGDLFEAAVPWGDYAETVWPKREVEDIKATLDALVRLGFVEYMYGDWYGLTDAGREITDFLRSSHYEA